MSERLRVNIGSGPTPYQGYISLDFAGTPDILHDLTQPLPFEDNSVDELVAIHTIEHFPLFLIDRMLVDWNRVLKPKEGVFWGIVPDGPIIAQKYLESVKKKDWGMKRVWLANFAGGYTNNEFIGPGQVHYALYDEDLLREKLAIGHFQPILLAHQQASPVDYRLIFICGKDVYDPADMKGVLDFKVPWAQWRENISVFYPPYVSQGEQPGDIRVHLYSEDTK